MRVLVLHGPNLNLLGRRRPEVYGALTLPELDDQIRQWGGELGLEVETFQSNHEGALIDRLHQAVGRVEGVVINPGALTHYSYSLHDAIEAVEIPTVEVHISNVAEREPWRRVSVVRPACVATIYGRGVEGYRWALRHLHYRRAWPVETLPYGDDPALVGDLRRPPGGGAHPLAVLIHGGFWRHMWTRDLMDGLAVDLVQRGVATWNLEYRRVGAGGGWPTSLDDVTAGVELARSLDGVEATRVALIGHSAGGHLALLAARSDPAPRVVVAMAAVTDLIAAGEENLGLGAAAQLLDGADPRAASPLHQLPLRVPQLVVHGTADDRVPVDHSRRYVEEARQAGDPVDYLEHQDVDHFAYLEPRHPAWQEVAAEVVRRLSG